MHNRYPFDRGGRGIPVQVAQKIAAERDELLALARQLKRENERLQGQIELLKEDRAELQAYITRQEEEDQGLRAQEQAARREAKALRERLKELEAKAQQKSADEELVEGLRRQVQSLTADIERLRRREGEALESAQRQERIRLLDGLGSVLDSVDRALRLGEPEGPWRQGLEGIQGQIQAFFKGEGAQIYGEPGEVMDPHIHEALAALEREGAESGEILEVERRGIRLTDGTLVRPAQVLVAR